MRIYLSIPLRGRHIKSVFGDNDIAESENILFSGSSRKIYE
jgi:hypothetical protein